MTIGFCTIQHSSDYSNIHRWEKDGLNWLPIETNLMMENTMGYTMEPLRVHEKHLVTAY